MIDPSFVPISRGANQHFGDADLALSNFALAVSGQKLDRYENADLVFGNRKLSNQLIIEMSGQRPKRTRKKSVVRVENAKIDKEEKKSSPPALVLPAKKVQRANPTPTQGRQGNQNYQIKEQPALRQTKDDF